MTTALLTGKPALAAVLAQGSDKGPDDAGAGNDDGVWFNVNMLNANLTAVILLSLLAVAALMIWRWKKNSLGEVLVTIVMIMLILLIPGLGYFMTPERAGGFLESFWTL